MIQERILELTEYGLVTGLVEPEDRRFTINRLLELFHLDELEDEGQHWIRRPDTWKNRTA